MNLGKTAQDLLRHIDPRLVAFAETRVKKIPAVQRRVEAEYEKLLAGIRPTLRPYPDLECHEALPKEGLSRDRILATLRDLKEREDARWHEGFASGAVYNGDEGHVAFLNEVYALHSQVNPLHADLWPSATRFEAEIVSMTARMLGGGALEAVPENERVCGTVTSGGTESILLAVKTYRDRTQASRHVRRPEILAPSTAHAAFDKAAQFFGMRLLKIPPLGDGRADVKAMRRALGRNTVVVVGSAPCFPYGTIDPIEELSEMARVSGVGFHTDACLGGFLLPWAERLGKAVSPFDFRLPGVTSISVDTHKYGYAAKGTSVVLYRGLDLRRWQYYTVADWPGGLYFSPTFAGSRPGALSAAAWAAMVSLGEEGYLDATRKILETADWISQEISSIEEIRRIGDSLFVIAFASDTLDVYAILDFLSRRGWSLNGLHHPPAVHLCVTLRTAEPGVKERFVADLRDAVRHVKEHPGEKEGMAPVYGLAATLPLKGVVTDLLKRYIDLLYEV
jgi:sphinganine-1-phosphate aldolase